MTMKAKMESDLARRTITINLLLEIARNEIGYHEKESCSQLDNPGANAGDENYTKYARDLHAAGYYQANKQGYDWCDMFVDWCHLQLSGSREVAEKVQCQSGPYGAGCGWSKKYYRDAGRLFHAHPEPGDQCFFRDSSHTGFVERVDDQHLYTIEGNTGNMVASHRYRLDDPRIDPDFGRPLWELVPEHVDRFTDVETDAYYAPAVRWAVENEITAGLDVLHFGPDQTCTRAQAVTMLWKMQGAPEPEGVYNPFADVQPTSWYAKAAQWAVQMGITAGYGNARTFAPHMLVSRGQIVVMLHQLAGAPVQEGSTFEDVKPADYYRVAVEWAAAKGITAGIGDGLFGPGEFCNRAQIVTMLYAYSRL